VIIDAHHHLWKVDRGDYFWLDVQRDPAQAVLNRDFGVEEYRALAEEFGIAGSVVVQAAQTEAETHWLLQQAAGSDGLIRGVVGWVDMTAADGPERLAALADNRLLVGIRPMLQDIADVDWMLQKKLHPVYRALIDMRLRFDLLIRPPHLKNALTLLARYPEMRVVIDHGAKPAIARGAWHPWADEIRRIANETGAYCKLSGLVTEATTDWDAEQLRRYVEHLAGCFGPQRLLWGSDWPVALMASDYGRWLETARGLLSELSSAAREAIFGANAIRFYGMDTR